MPAAKTTSKPATKQAVPQVTRAPTQVANRPAPSNQQLANATELDAQMAADSGAGFEEANRDAYAIPFLRILQDLSPQVKKMMAGYIEGAKPGQFFNTVSRNLYDEVLVIPCHFTQCFIEWTPRNKGGGFVKRYDLAAGAALMAQTVRDKARNVLPNGNELMDTREHYVLQVHEDGSTEGCLIALTSTALKVSRQWMTVTRSPIKAANGRMIEQPPMFAHYYILTPEEVANDQGSWHQWHIAQGERVVDMEIYNKAKAFHLAMKSGQGKVNYDDLAAQAGEDRPPIDLTQNEIDA